MKVIDDLEFDQKRYHRNLILTLIGEIEHMTGRQIHEFPKINKMYLGYCNNQVLASDLLKVLTLEVDTLMEGI